MVNANQVARIHMGANFRFLALVFVLTAIWSVQALAGEGAEKHKRPARIEPPIIVVPADYEGTVEMYMTPWGYQIKTERKGEASPYPQILKDIKESPPAKPEDEASSEEGDAGAYKE